MSVTNGSSETPVEAASLYGEQVGGGGRTLLDYLYTLWQGKWAILGIVCLVGGATYLYYQNQPRTYKASSAVLINEEERSERMAEFLPTQPTSRIGQELYFLRNSQSFARKVARRLVRWQDSLQAGQEASMFWRQDGTPRSEAQMASMVRRSVQVKRDAQEVPALRMSVTSTHPEEAAVVVNIYAEVYRKHLYRSGNARMRATRQFLQKQKAELQERLQTIEDSIDARVRANGQLGLTASEDSGMGVMGKSEQLTQKISDLEVQKSQVQIDMKMEQALLDSAQARLERIRPNLADRAASTTPDKLKQTQRQIAELEADIQTINARNESLSDAMQSKVEEMRSRIETLRERADRLAQTYVEQSLSTDAISPLGGEEGGLSSIVDLRQQITEHRIAITRLEAKRSVLNERLAEHRSSLRQSPDRTLARLRRRKNTTKELFVSLSKSLQRAQVSEESAPEQASIVRKASPPSRPIAPKMWSQVILAVLFSGAIGGVLVLLYDYYDDRIEGPDALERAGHDVFGVISEWTSDLERTDEHGEAWAGIASPFSPAAEEYRHLGTNVRLGLPYDVRRLVVTSPNPREGKTTTAANLAVALSESGKDVLLLDMDLRGPTLHRRFGVERTPGVADRLANAQGEPRILRAAAPSREGEHPSSRAEEEEASHPFYNQQQEQVGRLGLLPAGTDVPQPALLLQDAHLTSLLSDFEASWDVILVDSPPALAFDDVFRAAALSDFVLLVAAAERTRLASLEEVENRLKTVCPQGVASLLNRHQQASGLGDGYYYGYDKYEGYDYASYRDAPTPTDRLTHRMSEGLRRIMKG